MKTSLPLVVVSLLGTARLFAAEPASALSALKALPAPDSDRLAIIDGHDGTPAPQRWHFLVQDSSAENGLREFVVQDREIVARREISQFATGLTPDDVMGRVKVDSDTVGNLARRYAAANGLPVASMNFRLSKDPGASQPVWTVACLDAQEAVVGTIMVDADTGKVMAREGFDIEPPALKAENQPPQKRGSVSGGGFHRPGSRLPPPVLQGPDDDEDRIPVRRAEPVRRDRDRDRDRPRLPDPIRDVRSLIHRLLPF